MTLEQLAADIGDAPLYMHSLQRVASMRACFACLFHSLRHTFATELFNQRKHPKIIQSLLGHSSITQTMDTYSHLLEDVGQDEVGDLDEAFG